MKLHCDMQQLFLQEHGYAKWFVGLWRLQKTRAVMQIHYVWPICFWERAPKSRMHHVTCSVSNTASGKAVILSASFFQLFWNCAYSALTHRSVFYRHSQLMVVLQV